MKRLFYLLLVVSIISTCFAGCGDNQAKRPDMAGTELDPEKIGYYSTLQLPIDDKNTKIEILCSTAATNLTDSVVIQELSKRTGLNVVINAVPSTSLKEKAATLIASRTNLPDLMAGINVNEFGMQGAFEPIDDHIDELPNFKEIFFDKAKENNTIDFLKGLKAPDGKLYTWPVWDIQRDVNHGMLYRKDIFDKHDIKMWNGPDEFYETLKTLKTLYPDASPMVSKTKEEIFMDFAGMWNIRSVTTWAPYYDESVGVWKHGLTDPKMKEILDYLKKLYDEKLLDAEFLTMTQAAWTTMMTQKNSAFVTFDWISRMDMFYEQSKDAIPEYDLRFGNPVGPEGKVRTLDKIWGSLGATKSDKSILALKLMDYIISPSGAQLMTMGIEGVTYEMGEDDFAKYIGLNENQLPSTSELEEKYGLFIQSLVCRYDKRSAYYNYTEKEREAQDIMLNKKGGGFFPFDPILVFTNDELAQRNELSAPLSTAAKEFFTQYVLTESTGDSAWSGWLEKAKGLGSEKIVALYNDAQKRYDAE